MKCRFCKGKISGTPRTCPHCGKRDPLPVEDPGFFAMKRTAIMFGCIAALAVLAILLFVAMLSGWDLMESFAWLQPKENNVYLKDSYTVRDGKAERKSDEVIATVGDAVLTNGQLQAYYWMQVYTFLENGGGYAGFDLTRPLDDQLSPDGVSTWQQYFLKSALEEWQTYQAFALEAQRNGYQLPEDRQAYLQQLQSELQLQAQKGGFANADDMIRSEMGKGCSARDYVAYMQVYYWGYTYFTEVYSAVDPTREQIEAYYAENKAQLSGAGFGQDAGNYVDVHHILLMPTDGKLQADGSITYPETAWDTCRSEAEQLLSRWRAGEATRESFQALAEEYSKDTSTASAGGWIADLVKGDMDSGFDTWCFDAGRQPGDAGIVKTSFGYHLVYFVESEPIWLAESRAALVRQQGQQLVEDILAQYPMTVDYSKIVLGKVSLEK